MTRASETLVHDRPITGPSEGRSLPRIDAVGVLDAGGWGAGVPEVGQGASLTPERVERVASRGGGATFTAEARVGMARAAEILRAAHARGDSIYGLTTGFGPLVAYAADTRATAQGAGLIAHLGAGCGPMASREVVRATMLLRAHTLGMGRSGVDPAVADALLGLLATDVCPAVPTIGSVGASGDLIPLSHVARVLTGEGWVLDGEGRATAAGPALAAAGLTPLSLTGRDALAVVNGTTFMTAYASLAIARAERLITAAERLTGWLYRVLGCRSQALDGRLHAARGHGNQGLSAEVIRREAERHGPYEDSSRPLQEVYSLRCAPQFLGACRDNVAHARQVVQREIDGVSDNPVVCGSVEDPAILHGGNFQGQQVAFASDALNAALVQAAVLAERQIDVLVNPDLNGGAPLLLAWQPGATSGVAGAQITATAVVAEMRQHGGPCATSSIPTNGRNQDVVSMGTMAARLAHEQTERLAIVLSILAIAGSQLGFVRSHGRARGPVSPPPEFVPAIAGIREDRPLHEDITRVTSALLSVPGV